jgi:nucleoside-diphosphate-sugar epimerase
MRADLNRAHELLGFEPQVTLEEGLHLTLENDSRFRQGT